MKKRLLLVAVLSALLSHLDAQTGTRPANSDETLFNGHLIRVYKTAPNGYGYDIFFQNRLIVHQNTNPFTNSPNGLRNEEDAMKMAKWQIVHLQFPRAELGIPGRQLVPKEVAHQLKIAEN